MSKSYQFHLEQGDNDTHAWTDTNPVGVSSGKRGKKRLFLFMIGGSGASVMEPVLYFFEKQVEESRTLIIPTFIDRSFHSEMVSRSICAIDKYQTFMACKASDANVLSPYFFIDDGSLFDGRNNLLKVFNQIRQDDTVAFSYSVYNGKNVLLKQSIAAHIRQTSAARIVDLVFLPYFTLGSDLAQFDREEQYLRNITQCSAGEMENEHFFYVGLSKPSRYVANDFQRNPFNIVSLILANAIVFCLTQSMTEENSHFEYSIPFMSEYGLGDLIPQSSIRETAIRNDFTGLCWHLIINENTSLRFGKELDSDIIHQVGSFFDDSTQLILQLMDKTYHPALQIRFRREKDFTFAQVWRHFSKHGIGIGKWRLSKASFIDQLLQSVDKDAICSPRMLVHEVLNSIDLFISSHWKEISPMYY